MDTHDQLGVYNTTKEIYNILDGYHHNMKKKDIYSHIEYIQCTRKQVFYFKKKMFIYEKEKVKNIY